MAQRSPAASQETRTEYRVSPRVELAGLESGVPRCLERSFEVVVMSIHDVCTGALVHQVCAIPCLCSLLRSPSRPLFVLLVLLVVFLELILLRAVVHLRFFFVFFFFVPGGAF